MSWVTLRCPRCGAYLAAPSPGAATSWATCPHCYNALPVVGPRDPPPLFTWEVYPSLYPALPPPRAPGRHLPTVVLASLCAAAILLAGLAGILFLTGTSALAPGSFELSGVVEGLNATPFGSTAPLPGALVRLTSEGGYNETVLSGSDGSFRFTGIPSGGATLNVTHAGFSPVEVTLLYSKPFVAAGDSGGLTVEMTPANGNSPTSVVETPFPDLESLLTSLWSGTVLLGAAALLTIAGALAARRPERAPVAIAGGAAAIVAPVSLFLLGDTAVVPLAAYFSVALSALGAVAASLGAVPLLWDGPPPEPVEPD